MSMVRGREHGTDDLMKADTAKHRTAKFFVLVLGRQAPDEEYRSSFSNEQQAPALLERTLCLEYAELTAWCPPLNLCHPPCRVLRRCWSQRSCRAIPSPHFSIVHNSQPLEHFLYHLSLALLTFICMSTNPKDARAKGRAVGQAIVSLFDKMSIRDEAATYIAVAELDRLLPDSSTDISGVIEAINSVPYLLEFILCVSSDYGFELLSSGIMKLRPHTAEEFPSSTLYTLLAQFSVTLYLPYERVSDVPPGLVANRRSVDLAFSVLQAIALLNASDSLSEETIDVSGTRWAAKSREKQEKRRKRSIHTGRASTVDVKAIVEYGTQVPTSKPEAAELAATVIAEQMSVLRDYFGAFRKEDTVAFFKGVYLPLATAADVPTQRSDGTTGPVSPIIPLPSASQGAFPLVQPMKAAMYFDNAEGFGPWRVKVAGRAERDLRQWRKRDVEMFDIIIEKIKVLSNGNFTKDNQKQLISHGRHVEVPIYEAIMTRNTRLVYHIHCDIDFQDNVERQVIRVFGVYKHGEINAQFWETVSRQLNCRGAEYRKRCNFRNKPSYRRGEYIVLPQEFALSSGPEEEVATSPTNDSTGLTKEDMESLHSLLTLEKFITFSQAFLNTILAEQDVSHVFDVSPSEKKIIEHDSSCFVIGRSGTGKTTTMVFKILGIERTYDTSSFRGAMSKPRQLFVTQSQVLAKKVDEYYAKLHQSHATAHLSLAQLQEMASKSRAQRDRMVDEDEEILYTSTLPRRWGALDDSHFPLFLTFNHLCRLLEGEFRYLVEQEKVDANKVSLLKNILNMRPRSTQFQAVGYLQDEDSFLDYDKFREVYWEHFPQNGLNPDLVWGEFMAIIKGSEGALKSEAGYLDRDTYVGGRRRTQTSSSEQRQGVYTLFEAYLRRKKLNGHYDPADRTRMLMQSLKVARVPGKTVDFLYVDEVQDNFPIDCLVLRAICSNPHGLFWAGDTAQTIAAGSSFRLKDLKALLYGAHEETPSLGARRARPETFYLTRNYRSHAGIVNCADSVVQLISKFWLDTIDPLPQEKGMSPGSKPVFFSDQDAARLQRSIFRDSAGGGAIEFGARQCILVRDHAARERLKGDFGKIGQVLTIYEAKGLEFDDVLLYNFFGHSNVGYSQWRVLLNCVPGYIAPAFDDARHNGVCRELKNLYVAITRARQNLWITDCSQNAYPLRRIWAERGIVEEHIPGTPMPNLAVTSGEEEWAEAARSLFVKRQYSEAMDAFERANRPQERRVALAYKLREHARAAPANAHGKELSQPAAFSKAAEAFLEAVPGASELEDQQTYYRIAAECYVRSGNDRKAGAAYQDAGEYTLAAKHFRKGGMFDEAVAVIQSYEKNVDPGVAQSIMDVAKLYYIKENKLTKAKALFQDDDKALQEYMEDRDLNGPRASLHEQNGEYDEAAECHLLDGNDLKAIELFLRSNSDQSRSRAARCVLDGFWLYLSLGAPEVNWSDQTVIALSAHIESLQHRLPNDTLRDEMGMFRALAENDIPALANLGESFHSQNNFSAALLCLDRVFAHEFNLGSADSLSEVVAYLQTFLIYARILQRFSCVPDPCADQHLQRLFAFRKVTEDNEELFLLPKGSYLYARAQCNGSVEVDGAKGIHIARWDLERLIKTELRGRLKERVWNENKKCRTLPRLRPCLHFYVSGSCSRRECPQRHTPGSEVGTTYNSLVRIYTLQIMIFHTLYASEVEYDDLVPEQRVWLVRLYEALYPMDHLIGSLHVLSLDAVPELIQGRHIIVVWVQGFLNQLYPDQGAVQAFLTDLMRTTRLAMVFDRHAASDSLHRIPSAVRVIDKRPTHFLRSGNRNAYIVDDLLCAIQCGIPGALDRGVLFLNHVLYHRLNVDIAVLCDFMDHLCGAMLISRRLEMNKTLDGLTIPKSWLVRLLQDVNQLARTNTYRWSKYLACMNRFLGDVYVGNNAGYLLFEDRNFSEHGLDLTREIFFTRICRNLCFWGYNLRVREPVRDEIHKIISGMKYLHGGITSSLSFAYLYAKDWETLERTTLNSLADSTMDEIIQLSHASAAKPKTTLANIRQVVYFNTEDIPALLGATHIHKLSSIANDPEASNASMTSSSASAYKDEVYSSYKEQAVEVQDLEPPEDEQETAPPQAEFTDQQMIAAAKITTIYRKYALRKAATKDPLREMRHRIFRDFLVKSRTVAWQGSPYRFLFLGAVSYLFTVIEILKDHLHGAKSAAKARLRSAHNRELESVNDALNGTSRLLKEACRLHKALAPSANVHKACDMIGLKRLASEAESLAAQAEDTITQDQPFPWTVDLDLFRRIRDSGVL